MNYALATHQNACCFRKMNFLSKCESSTPEHKGIVDDELCPPA
jgi:hypothetical protein